MALAAPSPQPIVSGDPWLFVTVDPERARIGVPIGSAYVERYWTPTLGPSAVALLRLIARDLDRYTGHGAQVALGELACCLGLGFGGGRCAPIVRTMDRLVMFGFARWHAYDTDRALEVFAHAWPINPTRLRRLPSHLQADHVADLAAARSEAGR